MRTSLAVAAVCVASLLAGGTAALARRAVLQESREILPQPAAWVPFTAKVAVTHTGADLVVGVFYRSTNGSTRLETGPVEGDSRVVSVKDVPHKTRYVRGPDGTWVSSPMDQNAVEFAPMRFHTGMKNLAKYPYKVSILSGEPYSLNAPSGFSAYQYMTGNGGMLLLVPELNFFPVVQDRLDGRHEVYTDVVLGEPRADLFAVPAGAVVMARKGRSVPATAP